MIEKYFNNSKFKSSKYEKYFNVYAKLFSNYIGKEITFVEIGIDDGGSLEIWKNFFGQKAKIIGIDINPLCKKFENLNDNISVVIGDQSSQIFWKKFFLDNGKVDIILDDGGHTNKQQIITTTEVIPNINDNGIFLAEDTHTSYLKNFNSSQNFSFINFCKTLIDDVNFKFSKDFPKKNISLNEYVYSIQFFESFVAFFIDRSLCYYNKKIINSGLVSDVGNSFRNQKQNKFIKNKFYSLRSFFKIFSDLKTNQFLKKYFK
jgi:hypothetical protein